jgi:hypothetical protein
MEDAGNNLTSQNMRRIAHRWRQTVRETTSNQSLQHGWNAVRRCLRIQRRSGMDPQRTKL